MLYPKNNQELILKNSSPTFSMSKWENPKTKKWKMMKIDIVLKFDVNHWAHLLADFRILKIRPLIHLSKAWEDQLRSILCYSFDFSGVEVHRITLEAVNSHFLWLCKIFTVWRCYSELPYIFEVLLQKYAPMLFFEHCFEVFKHIVLGKDDNLFERKSFQEFRNFYPHARNFCGTRRIFYHLRNWWSYQFFMKIC